MTNQFKNLFSPLKVGRLTLRNRIVFLPMSMSYSEDGVPTDKLVAFIEARARGGVGMIITESQIVHPTGVYKHWNTHAFDDRCIPGLRLLAESCHRHGVPLIGHLAHMGLQMTYRASLMPLLAPSVLFRQGVRQIPKEMEHEDIGEIVDSFVQAALRNKEAGLDGVEIHSAHGHLLCEFLSPLTNLRTDDYGGSLENRMRFPMEILQSIRAAVGPEFVVGMRVSGDELLDGGLTMSEMKLVASRFAATGQLDYLSVSAGTYGSLAATQPSWYFPPNNLVQYAAGVKEVVGIPVITAARIRDPLQAENILRDGLADMVGMGRALFADPDIPEKSRAGKQEDIRPCIYCNFCFLTGGVTQAAPVLCAVNPDLGREREAARVGPAATRKRVLVAGGGPAGLEAALRAARRGHDVTLCEKEAELGGQVRLLAKDTNTAELARIVGYQAEQAARAGVNILLNALVTAPLVRHLKPDVVIAATGGRPYLPDVPGGKGKNVISYIDVLLRPDSVGHNVLIISGQNGFQPPLTTADFLAERGHKVEVLSELGFAGFDVERFIRAMLYDRLSKKGVALTAFNSLRAIEGTSAVVVDLYTKRERRIEGIDTFVIAAGTRADDGLYRALGGRAAGIRAAGDCIAPRGLFAAIYEGALVGEAV